MKRIVKWLPALVAPVVLAGAVATPAFAAGTLGSPPSDVRSSTPSAAQVLAMIANAKDAHYSGTIEQTSDLGLPQLPGGMGTSSSNAQVSSLLELLTSPHEARVYVDGVAKQRLQVLDSLAERDVVRNGASVWTWDSHADKATQVTLPSKDADGATGAPSSTPQSVAAQLVKKAGVDSTLSVTKGSVASRSVWRLTITPKTSQTLVGKAVLSIDTKTGVPLAAEIDARGQKSAAASVRFKSVDFGTPAASNFAFTPPKGAKVTHTTLPSHAEHPRTHEKGSSARPNVVGSGWTSIIAVPASALGGMPGLTSSESRTLTQLTQSVNDGRGLQTSLFSVLMTDDGRLYAGAVPLSALESAAG